MTAEQLDHAQVRRHFSEHAVDYDRYARVQKSVAEQLVRSLPRPPAGPVLDVGTGTGAVGAALLHRFTQAELTVSDLAHGMTLAAHARLPQARAVDADALALPFRVGSFDQVLSASVYQWVEDLPKAFAETLRVLKPGGRFALALFGEGTLCELEDVFRDALAQHAPERPLHFQRFPGRQQVSDALSAAGFRNIDCRLSHEVEYHAGVRDLLVSLKKIGAQNASTERPGGLFPRRVMLEMERLYRRRYADGNGVRASYTVLYAAGEKG